MGFHTKKKNSYCPKCQSKITRIEEKCTDVNLALQVFIEFQKNKCDKAIICSADNDFSSIPILMKECFSNKEISYIFPYKKSEKDYNTKIKKECKKLDKEGKKYNVLEPFSINEYQNSQFPNKVTLKNGKIITKPIEYY